MSTGCGGQADGDLATTLVANTALWRNTANVGGFLNEEEIKPKKLDINKKTKEKTQLLLCNNFIFQKIQEIEMVTEKPTWQGFLEKKKKRLINFDKP